ncbi:MAG: hypothetical protein AAF696_00780 [Bacteroidota bacterium]
MKKKERIISLFIDKKTYEKGEVDITEMLYKIVPEDQIEAIKYLIPSSTEAGIYYTIYILEKKESSSGLGFTN